MKIRPKAVERALLPPLDAREAAVHGKRDADQVERVHAAVVQRHDTACSAGQLRAHVGTVLSPPHAPTRITYRDSLPLDERGKPDKAHLRSATPLDKRPSPPLKGTP